MPRTLPSRAFSLIASTAVTVLLAAHLAAAALQKPAPPPPTSQAQLEARVEDLETRLAAAEQKADKATMEKEYILRTQNHYEAYYKEVFSTQTHILWTIGVTATLLSITLTAVFFIAGRFGFNIFDRRIEMALSQATAQLRTEFTESLGKESQAQREANDAQLKALERGLTQRITEQENDLKTRSEFQFQCAQAFAKGMGKRYADAQRLFCSALEVYKSSKPRHLFQKHYGATTVQNILIGLKEADKANFEANAIRELARPLYNDLDEELALVALDAPELAPLLKARTQTPTKPPAAKPKIGEEPPSPAKAVPPPKDTK